MKTFFCTYILYHLDMTQRINCPGCPGTEFKTILTYLPYISKKQQQLSWLSAQLSMLVTTFTVIGSILQNQKLFLLLNNFNIDLSHFFPDRNMNSNDNIGKKLTRKEKIREAMVRLCIYIKMMKTWSYHLGARTNFVGLCFQTD